MPDNKSLFFYMDNKSLFTIRHKKRLQINKNLKLNKVLCFRFYINYDSKFSETTGDSPDSSDSEESRDFGGKPRGLVGLQNIGNTCYMNSAIQALSNVVPLTQYFLDCGQVVAHIVKDRKPGLSLNYMNMVKDMWNRKTRGYVVPNGILSGIRAVNPMFRGYHQHDTQEFLRCFMDQLHEELKERVDEDREQHVYLKVNESPFRSGAYLPWIVQNVLRHNLYHSYRAHLHAKSNKIIFFAGNRIWVMLNDHEIDRKYMHL